MPITRLKNSEVKWELRKEFTSPFQVSKNMAFPPRKNKWWIIIKPKLRMYHQEKMKSIIFNSLALSLTQASDIFTTPQIQIPLEHQT